MENDLRKVRVLENNGSSPLIKVEDDNGEFWIRRSRVHLVGNDYIITSESQASIMRGSLARQKAREVKRLAKEKLAREEKAVESKIRQKSRRKGMICQITCDTNPVVMWRKSWLTPPNSGVNTASQTVFVRPAEFALRTRTAQKIVAI